MSKILIIGKDEERAQTLIMEWELQYTTLFKVFSDSVSMLRYLNQNMDEVRGIIILLDNNLDKNIQLLPISNPTFPQVLIEESNSKNGFTENVYKFLQNQGIKKKVKETTEYVAIRYYDFMTFSVAPCDIFIRMGVSNHVKILNKDELYSKEILEHYRDKKIKELYIRKADSDIYFKDLHDTVKDQLVGSDNISGRVNGCVAGLDYVNSSMREIGIDQTSIDIAHETINSTLEALEQSPDIFKKIKDYMNSGSYLAEHSLATAALCVAITRNLHLSNMFTIKKLVIASLFHDIALMDKELALIINTNTMEYSNISEDKKKEFAAHIYEGVEFIRKIPSLPANVDSIVLEHHERPNGKGYPRGLDSVSISPLSCIFIVAEEFVHHMLRSGMNIKNRDATLELMSQDYNKGNFKGPMNSLLRIFL